MEYETSNNAAVRPFNHDKSRGKWESPNDFLFACVGHAFKLDVFTFFSVLVFKGYGLTALLLYIAAVALSVVPIILLQSFLGQFSSTGFISVFRVAPLYKVLGYVSLLMNFITLIIYGVLTSVSLFYMCNSFKPTLPWSCEGASEWMNTSTTICNGNHIAPSVEFFKNHLNLQNHNKDDKIFYSTQLMICLCIVWAIVTFLALKPTELIGRIMRYSFMVFIAFLSLLLLRLVFLPGAMEALLDYLVLARSTTQLGFLEHLELIPLLAMSTMGPGWGSIVTMASFNDFKTNIFRYSWLISLVQLGVITEMLFLTIILDSVRTHSSLDVPEWTAFLKFPTVLATLEFPNFWSVILFGMLTMGSLNFLVIQYSSLLTSIFDEFETLRDIKKYVSLVIVAFNVVVSLFFCSNYGVFFCEFLLKLHYLAQAILNLLLLLVIFYVYGLDQFQRDLKFMTSQMLSTFKVCLMVTITPIILACEFSLGMLWLFAPKDIIYSTTNFFLLWIFLILLIYPSPFWCLLPVCCIFCLYLYAEKCWSYVQKYLEPKNWYPADPDHKQRYEELLRQANLHRLDSARDGNV